MSPHPAIRTLSGARARRLAARSLAGTLPGRVQPGAVAGPDRGRGVLAFGFERAAALVGKIRARPRQAILILIRQVC